MRRLWALTRLLSLRYSFRRPLRTLLTLAGISLGVALVLAVGVMGTALSRSVETTLAAVGGNADLEVAAPDQVGLPRDVVRRVRAVPGVGLAVPVLKTTTTFRGEGGSARLLVLGVTSQFTALGRSEAGDFGQFEVDVTGPGVASGGALVSSSVSSAVGVAARDEVEVQTPRGDRTLPVAGVISGRAVDVLNGGYVAFLPLARAQDLFDRAGRIDNVYVAVEDDRPPDEVAEALRSELEGAATVAPPGHRASGLSETLLGVVALASLGATAALFVAGFVVYNTLMMTVTERRKEISLASALGAERRHLVGSLLSEAIVLGAFASLLGTGLGWILSRVLLELVLGGTGVLPISHATADVDPAHVVVAFAIGVVVSACGAFLPALRILQVAPIEALRPEASYEWRGIQALGLSVRRSLLASIGAFGVAIVLAALFVLGPSRPWLASLALTFVLLGTTFLIPVIVPHVARVAGAVLRRSFGIPGRLAGDGLVRNPGRTSVTVAALALTLGVVIAVGSAFSSYKNEVRRLVLSLTGGPLYVVSASFTGVSSDQPLPGDLRPALENVDEVSYVFPLRISLVSLDDLQTMMLAVPIGEIPAEGGSTDYAAFAGDARRFVDGLEAGGIAVSEFTAQRLDVETGDSIAMHTPAGERRLEVVDVFRDLTSLGSAYIDYETYTRWWRDDKVDEFGLVLEDGADVDRVEEDVGGVLQESDVDGTVLTRYEVADRLVAIIDRQLSVATGIQLAALVVAALSIANTMFIAIMERRWEIALQRALGMGRRHTLWSLALEVAAMGLIGALGAVFFGAVVGGFVLKAMETQYLWRLPYSLPLTLVGTALLVGTTVALVAGTIPVLRATRASIVSGMRSVE